MSTITDRSNKTHLGRNIKRFREILGVKQESLAITMGDEWNQKRISMLESKPNINDDLLEQVAEALKIPAEAIKNFDEEKTMFNIQHNYEGSNVSSSAIGDIGHNACTFNPLDKLMQTVDELKSLYVENKNLYERMLEIEKEKFELLKSQKE